MEDRMEECIQPGVGKGKDVSAVRETIENVIKQVPREPVCMTRSDSMSIGSIGSASDVASVGGASEEMDTEDSEKDARESFMSSTSSFSSVDGQRKRSADSLSLVLDNQRNLKPGVNEMGSGEGPTTGDVTSPVFENKLSDNVEGYFMMRTRLLSKSAVILENGGAFGEENHPVLCDSDEANQNVISGKCENEHVGRVQGNSAERISEDGGPNLVSECQGSENGRHDAIKNEPAETQNTLSCEGHFQTIISDLAGAEHGGRGRDDERHSPRGVSDGFRSNDISIKSEPASEGEEEHEQDETSALLTRTVVGDALDSSCSDSMAEVEKFGLEAKLARVSKRRVYSKASEMAYKDSNSSSESDSDSDSEEEEEEEKDSMLEDLHAAKVLVNAAQPDSEKMIKREVLKMVCPDDLLSDYVSSEDSSASSSDSSSGESSDSEDSSDSDLSSVDESDDEEEEEEVKTSKPRQNQTAPRDGLNQDLPKVEYVQINLPDSVQLTPLGTVSSIIGSLVIIQAEPGTPAINTDSVLFKADRTVLGQVYEIFGPVASPFYSVRFNCPVDIEEHGVRLQTRALFAPQNIDVTQYVFTEQLKKCRGSDASWKNDEEPPDEFRDFSDDEEESLVRNKKKKDRKRKVPQGKILNGPETWTQNGPGSWNQGPRRGHFQSNVQRDQPRAHPPLQRTTPAKPLLPFPAGSGPRPPRGFSARSPASFHGPPHPSTRGHPAFGHMGMRGPPPEIDWSQRFPAPWNLPPPPPPPPPSSRDNHSGQFQGNPFLLGQQPSYPPTLSGQVLHSPMFQNPFVNAPPPLMSPPVSCPPPSQATAPGAALPPAASPLAMLPLQQHQQHQQQGPHQVRGFSARKTDSALSRQKRQTGDGGQAVYSARKSGIAPPWQKKQPVQPAMTTSVASAVPAKHPPPLMGQPSSLGASTIPVGGNSTAVQSLSSRMSLFPPTNLPPPPVPPPAFHPRMMQSFRRPPNARGGFTGAS
ncbi:uncharacterized protein [Diadema antillarum]|uniref:uncharacterized protein n=1 Tax=Diadema antillarum TaxID=105358 RepID=UPI003A83C1DD